MEQGLLSKLINNLSTMPIWVKELITAALSNKVDEFTSTLSYKPILTYKGLIELTKKTLGFDNNIYGILEAAQKDNTISDITLTKYFTLEETLKLILFCIEQGFIEQPQNKQITNIIKFLTGKSRIGEYLIDKGDITEYQLQKALEIQQTNNKRIGKIFVTNGYLTEENLSRIIAIKNETKHRYIFDKNKFLLNNLPSGNKSNTASDLEYENKLLKDKLDYLLSIIK